jgi:hypothetical protein
MTDVTLLDHLESRIKAVEKSNEQSNRVLEKRLDSMNEFREALKDQVNRSPSRAEMDAKFQILDKDIKLLNTFMDTQQGKATMNDVNGAKLVAYIGLALGIATLVLHLVSP